jgi:hypothetical protein
MLPADARYPSVELAAGHYESFYLKAADAASRRALWLRYTVHKRPGERPVGSLWATLFDEDGPHAAKVSLGPDALGAGGADHLRIGDSRIGADGARGEIPGLASWALSFDGDAPPFHYLPRAWMYTARIPRTKALSLRPALRASGTVTVGERTVELDRWLGMVGHNWGAEHAERWIWMHGTAFEEDSGAWLDATIGRLKLGRWTTPWVANGCLSLDGVRHRLGGIERVRRTHVAEAPERCTFELPGKGIVVHGEIAARREQLVGWVYSDPPLDAPQHHTTHCAIADMALRVERPGRAPLALTVRGGATYELGMREHDHDIPIQPFPDP